jgi:hypothetical protein
MTPEAIQVSIRSLLAMRHKLVREAKATESDSLVPFLQASVTVAALDNAVRALEEQLREAVS